MSIRNKWCRPIPIALSLFFFAAIILLSVSYSINREAKDIDPTSASSISLNLERLGDASSIFLPFEAKKHNDNTIVEYAEILMSGMLVVSDTIPDRVMYQITDIDWNISATSSPNTFSLFLQSLNPVYYLCRASEITNDSKYFIFANEMVDSWINYLDTARIKNEYVWYDHAVGLRTENLLYYCTIQEKQLGRIDQALLDVLISHSEWLMDSSNYVFQQNHGIYEDAALLKLGYFFSNDTYYEYAIQRLDKQIEYAFPHQYAHIENSIGYNIGVLDYLVNISSFLFLVNNQYAHRIQSYLDGALSFLLFTIPPNNIFPAYGDTFKSPSANRSASTGSLYRILEESRGIDQDTEGHLLYALSAGREGLAPTERIKTFPQDGYSFIRSSWDIENYTDSLFLMFKSGFNSLTHKHKDDLSIVLNNKGTEILIDPGMYNYMVGNVLADYLNDTYSHNTIIVDNEPYPLGSNLIEKAGVLPSITTDEYSILRGFNNLYNGVWIERSIIYINQNEFYLIDDIKSDSPHTFTQNFHLSNNVEIVHHENDYTLLSIRDTEWYLLIQQINPIDSILKKNGNTENIKTMSIMSNGLNSYEDTTSIQYNREGQDTRFVTSLCFVKSIDIADGLPSPGEIEDDSLLLDGLTIDISSRVRATPTEVDVIIKNDLVYVSNPKNQEKGLQSCYYLLNNNSGVISKTEYSFDSSSEFELDKNSNYTLISYSRTEEGQRSSWRSGYIQYCDDRFEFSSVDIADSVPRISARSVRKEANNYVFSLTKHGFSSATTRWYVYRNGSGYDYLEGDYLDYSFRESGLYTILYRVRDSLFGEVEFGHFSEIDII